MLTALESAIVAALSALPGVATCRPYAGELEGSARATLLVPALLLALTDLEILPDPGTGEIAGLAKFSLFCCTRDAASPEARGRSAWDLAVAALLAIRGQSWGVPRVSPALLGAPVAAGAQPLWRLEDKGLAVREVRWTHQVRLGASDWAGDAIRPTLWASRDPFVGAAWRDAYREVSTL